MRVWRCDGAIRWQSDPNSLLVELCSVSNPVVVVGSWPGRVILKLLARDPGGDGWIVGRVAIGWRLGGDGRMVG